MIYYSTTYYYLALNNLQMCHCFGQLWFPLRLSLLVLLLWCLLLLLLVVLLLTLLLVVLVWFLNVKEMEVIMGPEVRWYRGRPTPDNSCIPMLADTTHNYANISCMYCHVTSCHAMWCVTLGEASYAMTWYDIIWYIPHNMIHNICYDTYMMDYMVWYHIPSRHAISHYTALHTYSRTYLHTCTHGSFLIRRQRGAVFSWLLSLAVLVFCVISPLKVPFLNTDLYWLPTAWQLAMFYMGNLL